MQADTKRYVVYRAQYEVPGVVTVYFRDEEGRVPHFSAGQYINVFFPELHIPEGRAYSISSDPDTHELSITVKAMGACSDRLCALSSGDLFYASEPYGYFVIPTGDDDLILVAAGIGVAPFRSMILKIISKEQKRKIHLMHSIRSGGDAIFRSEFEKLKVKSPQFTFEYFITREKDNPQTEGTFRRMTAHDVYKKIDTIERTHVLVCGPMSFTRDMRKGLAKEGIPDVRISTEAFFSN